jgi:hypothetical protein
MSPPEFPGFGLYPFQVRPKWYFVGLKHEVPLWPHLKNLGRLTFRLHTREVESVELIILGTDVDHSIGYGRRG